MAVHAASLSWTRTAHAALSIRQRHSVRSHGNAEMSIMEGLSNLSVKILWKIPEKR